MLDNEIKNDGKQHLDGGGSMYSLIQKYILSPASKIWGFIKHNWLDIITVLFLLYVCVGAYMGFTAVNQLLLSMVKQAWTYLDGTSLGKTVCPWLKETYVLGSCLTGKLFGLTPPGSSEMCLKTMEFAQGVEMKAAIAEATTKAEASSAAAGFKVGTAGGALACGVATMGFLSSFFAGPLGVVAGASAMGGCASLTRL